jgi:soluble P-type ATPase
MQDCGDLETVRIMVGNEAEQKCGLLKKLGASQTVALGNGANDALMLRKACLGICVMQGEGTAWQLKHEGEQTILAKFSDQIGRRK